jgi:hypothetical protein
MIELREIHENERYAALCVKQEVLSSWTLLAARCHGNEVVQCVVEGTGLVVDLQTSEDGREILLVGQKDGAYLGKVTRLVKLEREPIDGLAMAYASRTVMAVFSGRRQDNAEVHLGRDELREIVRLVVHQALSDTKPSQ